MRLISLLLLILSVSFSCKKEDPVICTDSDKKYTNGFLVLNEGLFQQNNSTLSFISNDNSVQNEVFLSENARLLGDTGNDMKIYGSKIYIVVNASSIVEVLDKASLKSIKQINLINNGVGQQPRSIDFANGKGYVSSYDGFVNVIDTVSLEVLTRIAVGNNPEDVVVSNNYLFVSNSGGLNAPNYDSTVMQIGLNTNTVIATYNVGANPSFIKADTEGDIYVIKRGDYSSDLSSIIVLDAQNNYEISDLNIRASNIDLVNDKLYIGDYNYTTSTSNVAVFDCVSESIENNSLVSNSSITTLYGVHVFNNQIYCFDAQGFTNSGSVKKFNINGELLNTYSVGLNPNTIIKL